jgi:hypothetical protein
MSSPPRGASMSERMIDLDDPADDDAAEIEIGPQEYPWTEDPDEWRRCFVLAHMGNADIHGPVLIENMQAVVDWLKTGKLSAQLPAKKSAR